MHSMSATLKRVNRLIILFHASQTTAPHIRVLVIDAIVASTSIGCTS